MSKKPRIHKKIRDNSNTYGLTAILLIAVIGFLAATYLPSLFSTRAAIIPRPVTPPALICGDSSILDGPATAPAGSISVPAGDNSGIDLEQAGKTYWFAPGTHTLGSGQYSQIAPGDNSSYIGAPGAILDGQGLNNYAFTQHAVNVTIQHLTIRNFVSPMNEGVVNHDSGTGWTMEYNTLINNKGGAMFLGTDNVARYNCLKDNGQYGFQGYSNDDAGPSNILLDHNEVSGNNTDDWESKVDGCGCTGGGKFWDAHDVTITNNYIHDNHSVGIWADTNNSGFLLEGNYISGNDNVGFFYETSYNAMIRNNTFISNALVEGVANSGFPQGAVYLSESGGDSRVAGNYSGIMEITGNLFKDNWSGVILWENADRFCNSPANTSSGYCTDVNPSVVKLTTCTSTNIANAPYFNDCRWKTQNVQVHDNVFQITPANIGATCTVANTCGFNGVFSQWGTYPSWSPYKDQVVEDAVTYSQNNLFSNNTYQGPWQFMTHEAGNAVSWSTWRASPSSQDAGSTYDATPPTSTPPTVTVTDPANGASLKDTVSVAATASDDGSVEGVQFKLDGASLGAEDTTAPYSISLDTTSYGDGNHTLSATARDDEGNLTTASISVTIQNTVKSGDINRDSNINTIDLSFVLSNWNKSSGALSNADTDINSDGIVNTIDLSIVLSNWGK